MFTILSQNKKFIVYHNGIIYVFLFEEMKLSEYFLQQHAQQLSSQMKSDIFFRIQKEKLIWSTLPSTLNPKKFFIASKHLVYSSLATLIALFVFGWILLDKKDIIDLWFLSIKTTNPNEVHAGYVAEIIEFNWDYSITRWNKILWLDVLTTNLINDGDVVKMDEWTELIFTLMDWTQAKIDGPAEFSIIKSPTWYQISLIDGKFFKIYCPECVSDIEIITSEASIHQNKDQSLDLQIANDNGNMLVKNNWDEVAVVTKSKEESETKLDSKTLVSIDTTKNSINMMDDSDLMIAFMTKNNISGTFNLSTDNVERPTVTSNSSKETLTTKNNDTNTIQKEEASEDNQQNKELNDQSVDPILLGLIDVISSDDITTVVDENITAELWIMSNEKQVPSETQMQSIKSNLNSFFLMNLFESIYKNQNTDQWISQLAERINAVAITLWYSDHAQSDLNSIKQVLLSLQWKIEDNWYISPAYLLQLWKVANRCDTLMDVDNEKNSQDERELFKSNLPTNLRLM